tara:strand:+ start:23 stop:997 length:975 start_codon:yes stop_codon:yes gene_type:complete
LIHNDLILNKIKKVYDQLLPYINITPLIVGSSNLNEILGTNIILKFECFQKSGSFKIRGAINNILSIGKENLKNGITAVSAGNHAIAASYVANLFNLKNKIYIYENANSYRINICKNLKANIIFTNAEKAFENVKKAENEGYTFIHPFDGKNTLQGSATLGLETLKQLKKINKKIDNVVISVGGGGLISGIGSYIKQVYPNTKVIGVEPLLANGMTQSIKINNPLNKVKISSIADSLCAPLHMPYSFSVAKNIIDEMINVTEDEIKDTMIFAFNNFKLFLEPACVVGLAAIKYHLKDKIKEQNTLLILCGSNLDYLSWKKIILN